MKSSVANLDWRKRPKVWDEVLTLRTVFVIAVCILKSLFTVIKTIRVALLDSNTTEVNVKGSQRKYSKTI